MYYLLHDIKTIQTRCIKMKLYFSKNVISNRFRNQQNKVSKN